LTGLLLVLTGCCTVNKEAAAKLANEGASAAHAIAETYRADSQSLSVYVEGEYLLSALNPGYSPPGDAVLHAIEAVQSELQSRQRMLNSLGDVYVSFGSLCACDAKSDVENSLGAAVQAGNDLSTKLGGGAISDSAGKLFAAAGGEIAGQAQCGRIKSASEKIGALLHGVVFLLQKTNEQASVVALRQEITRGKLKVAQALWTNDLALANGILDQQVQAYGLTPNHSALARASQSPGLRAGVSEILRWRQKQEQSFQTAAYGATIQALRGLINEHVNIEKGDPVSLGAVQDYLATVQKYVDLITAVEKGQ
jgi:hypothetical protein